MTQNELYHYGVLGMKWGVRRTPDQLGYHKSDSSVTKRVKKDYNSMNDQEFLNKYKTSKRQYAKRVEKYGDPYMNGPMAKMGKKLAAKEKAKTAQLNAKNKRKQAIYGKRGQARIEKHIDKGNSRSVAYGREMARQLTMGTVGTYAIADLMMGGAMSKQAFMKSGKKFADSYAKRKARKSITKIARNPYFDPIDVAYKVIT